MASAMRKAVTVLAAQPLNAPWQQQSSVPSAIAHRLPWAGVGGVIEFAERGYRSPLALAPNGSLASGECDRAERWVWRRNYHRRSGIWHRADSRHRPTFTVL